MKERINYSGGSPWEPLRGFSRAVQLGDNLYISGTTALDESGEVIAAGEPYEQTKFVIERIKCVLSSCGFTVHDVVRTRMSVTLQGRWADYARAHRETFESIRPASSMIQVARLVDPRLVIEMEVDAVRGYDKRGYSVIDFSSLRTTVSSVTTTQSGK